MPTITVGVANQSATVTDGDVKRLAAALDIQVKRDLKPIWQVDAEVIPLSDPRTIPRGVHPIMVVDDTPNGVAGFHRIEQGVTWAMVNTRRDWRLAASHECLEMLVDPTGMKMQPARGIAIAGAELQDIDDEFHYVLEVCDPIEDCDHAYDIGGVLVSDFYTPEYFDREFQEGVRYSLRGALTRPRQIGRNGYLSWWHPQTEKLHQIRNIGGYKLYDLPPWNKDAGDSARMFIDRHTRTPRSHPR